MIKKQRKLQVGIDAKKGSKWHHNVTASFTPFSEGNTDKLLSFFLNIDNIFDVPVIVKPRGIPAGRYDNQLLPPGNLKGGAPIVTTRENIESIRKQLEKLYGEDEQSSSPSWILLSELLDYDYTVTFFNKAEKRTLSVEEFLGDDYFNELKQFSDQCEDFKPSDVRLFFYATEEVFEKDSGTVILDVPPSTGRFS
jgi:hypothetical protein